MTYTSNLDDTQPGQADKVRLGAGWIRNLTKAVKERLLTVFMDPNADPLVFRPDVIKSGNIAADVITTRELADSAVIGANVLDDTLTWAKMNSGAKVGIYKLLILDYVYAGANMIADSTDTQIIAAGVPVNGLMTVPFFRDTFDDTLIARLKITSRGVGSTVHLTLRNIDPSNNAVIPAGATVSVAVYLQVA